MIQEFGDKETKLIWEGISSKKIPYKIQNVARRKLRMMNNTQDILDLIIPSPNNIEKLKGKLKEYYSIQINKQWRIIFKWKKNDMYEVKIIDDH